MRGLLGCLALGASVLVACDDALVIEVIVPDGMPAKHIDLFVADGECRVDVDDNGSLDACRGVSPDFGFRIDSDEIYFTDRDGIAPQPADGPGTYVFRLEQGAHDDDIPMMIAVASVDGGATGSAILKPWKFSDGPLRLQVPLVDDHLTHVWRAGGASCVGVERDNGDIVFLVSRRDPDCDGFLSRDDPAPATECDPLAWHGRVEPESFAISCVGETEQAECLLGGAACEDGAGMVACSLTEQCVPTENCQNCQTNTDPACLEDTRSENTVAKLVCDVHVQDPGVGTGLVSCNPALPDPEVPVELELELFPGNGKCSEISFAPPDDPTTYDLTSYRSDLEIQTDDTKDPAGLMRFTVQSRAENCVFSLRWQGPTPPTAEQLTTYTSTIALRVKDGLNPRVVMLPLVLSFGSCDGQLLAGKCAIAGNVSSIDSVNRCTQ